LSRIPTTETLESRRHTPGVFEERRISEDQNHGISVCHREWRKHESLGCD
jgi:hypothetical protein